jgi:hypothetical protein
MKKIFLLIAAVCTFVGCDPTHEDISNGGHITVDELLAKTTVTTDKAPSGANGNVISCETLAPVNARWTIGDKEFIGNFAKKKMKLGEYTILLTAICADGTELTAKFPGIQCVEVTDPLQKFYIYPRPGKEAEDLPFKPGAWNAAAMRFSDSEGQHFPYISDDVYWGFKTLIMDVTDVEDGTTMMVHNGWWSATYIDSMPIVNGPNEIQLTEDMAKDCAKGNGGSGKDLQFLIKSGNCTVNSVYYEE